MRNFLSKFKIPTILGLSIIIIGIITGVFLVLRDQIFISKASPDVTAQNITLSNVSETEVTISYQTSIPTISFITFGQVSPNETTALDDRDSGAPQLHTIHYITLKNLLPKTTYQYKIVSGKISSEIGKFITAAPLTSQAGFRPIIGSVLDGDKPLDEGIVYLSIAGATTQSAQVKSGNFLIPLSQIRKSDLSDIFPLSEDTIAKLTIVSNRDQANMLFQLTAYEKGLPPISLGENLDLTNASPAPQPSPLNQNLDKYDLNDDGKINAADNAIVLQNYSPLRQANKNPKDKRADLNSDGVVDQKDLDLMAKQINQ